MKKILTTITTTALLASAFTLSVSAMEMGTGTSTKEIHKMEVTEHASGTKVKEVKTIKKVKKTHKVSHKNASTTEVKSSR